MVKQAEEEEEEGRGRRSRSWGRGLYNSAIVGSTCKASSVSNVQHMLFVSTV